MKTKFMKFALPIGLGMILLVITFMGIMSVTLTGCEKDQPTKCKTGSCLGNDGLCYGPCSSGFQCTTTPSGNCSAASAGGVYCCGGGNTGCTPTGCASSTPWLCGAYCYATPPSGNHSCIKCP